MRPIAAELASPPFVSVYFEFWDTCAQSTLGSALGSSCAPIQSSNKFTRHPSHTQIRVQEPLAKWRRILTKPLYCRLFALVLGNFCGGLHKRWQWFVIAHDICRTGVQPTEQKVWVNVQPGGGGEYRRPTRSVVITEINRGII